MNDNDYIADQADRSMKAGIIIMLIILAALFLIGFAFGILVGLVLG